VDLLISARSEKDGGLSSAQVNLTDALTLGRGPESPVQLEGTGISREHFRLHAEGAEVFVTDLSSNGTWLNLTRLTRGESRPLTPADTIRIPGFEIRIQLRTAAAGLISQAAAGPNRNQGPFAFLKAAPVSLSRTEKCVVVLAAANLFLLIAYLTS
jgi:predicted component of type VI protein secretion system